LNPAQRELATDHPEVSVVVPAYLGISTIAACLASIRRAAAERRVEILVVESSGDGTTQLVRARFPGVIVIASPKRLSAGQARNEGFRHCRGRFILCVDQDCIVEADWIQRMVDRLSLPGVDAAGGSVGVANPRNIPGWCVYFLEFFTHLPTRGAPCKNNFLLGANSGYRAEVTRQLSFPDQTLGEDVLDRPSLVGFEHRPRRQPHGGSLPPRGAALRGGPLSLAPAPRRHSLHFPFSHGL
jgi:glycosyltransferase involved in cell wall biosynthesis